MRIFTASVIIAVVSLGTPAFVQAQGAPSQSEAQTPPAQSSAVIRSIQVVDLKELQPAVRSKVNEAVRGPQAWLAAPGRQRGSIRRAEGDGVMLPQPR